MNGWKAQGPNLKWAEVELRMKKGERLSVVIHGHPCTGDHIICCGLYRTVARNWQVNILVRPGDEDKVCMLMQGIKDAAVISVPDQEMSTYCASLKNEVVLRLGDYSGIPFDHNQFDVDFYKHAGVPFCHRWDSFHAPAIEQVPVPDGDYDFVHERPELCNARLPFPGERPRPNRSIFAHRELILGAKALHCCSSSFAAFAECFDLTGKNLNFYPFGREIPTFKNPWKIWK